MSLTSKITRQKLDILVRPYKTDEKVLDVGAFGMPSYARYFSNRIGFDIKPGPGVDVIGSVYDMPFKDGEFDVILCLSVLEHLENPLKAIAEMKRVLKTGGKIIISVPFMFPIHDAPGDYWRFTKFGLMRLFDTWKIEKIVAETTTQETFAVLFQRLAYQTKMRLNKLSKLVLFILAYILMKMPNPFLRVFGDIKKSKDEPEAFASAIFIVARKI